MPQALRARTVSEDTWRMPVTRLTRATHLAGHGWRVGNWKQSTANQATESIASTIIYSWRRQFVLFYFISSLLEHAGALLSMEYPAVNLKNLKFEGSTVGISHISDISIRNPSGNPPTFFFGHLLRCVNPGGVPGLPTGYRVRCLPFHGHPGLVHLWFIDMGIHGAMPCFIEIYWHCYITLYHYFSDHVDKHPECKRPDSQAGGPGWRFWYVGRLCGQAWADCCDERVGTLPNVSDAQWNRTKWML